MRLAASMVFAFVIAAPSAAHADSRASALFDSGLSEMRAGHYETACPALAESYRIDPLPGALFTLAECESKWGKLASAVGHYADYVEIYSGLDRAEQKRQKKRVEVARSELDRLRPRVPRLSIRLSSATADVEVRLDENPLSRKALDLPQPVDPGEHVVAWSAAGAPAKSETIRIEAGEQRTFTIEVPPPPPVSPAPRPAPSSKAPPKKTERIPESSSNTFAYVALGIGVVGLATGLVSGGLALREKNAIDDNCEGDRCNHDGKRAADRANRFAIISNIGFGVGVVGTGVGVIALTLGSSSANKPEAATFSVKGRW